MPDSPKGLVGIHVGQVRFQTAEELVDFKCWGAHGWLVTSVTSRTEHR